jgi:ATP-dependent Clp protease ATP-binding subunit ClpA
MSHQRARCIIDPPLTPRATKAISRSKQFARNLGLSYVGIESLLVGVISEPDGMAREMILRAGIDPDRFSAKIRSLVTEHYDPPVKSTPEAPPLQLEEVAAVLRNLAESISDRAANQ